MPFHGVVKRSGQWFRLLTGASLLSNDQVVEEFNSGPYQPAFLNAAWDDYLAQTGATPDQVNPDAFVRWTYARALAHRQPRYADMAKNWGIKISADDVARVKSPEDFESLLAQTLEAHGK